MAVIMVTANVYGQKNCEDAVPLSNFNTVQDYLMDNDQYWLTFTADSIDFYLSIISAVDPTPYITTINLYKGDDCNYDIVKTINLQAGDSIIETQLNVNDRYYLQIIHDGSNFGIFTMYCSNISRSDAQIQCLPVSCIINPNTDFDNQYLSPGLVSALNGNPLNSDLLLYPMNTPPFSDVCNWRAYGSQSSPQIAVENGNNYLYMWAQADNSGIPYQEEAYNKLSNVVGPTGIGLTAGQDYTLSLKYREVLQGVDGFRVFIANENATGILSDFIPVVDFPLNGQPNTPGFNSISFPMPAIPNNGINYNAVLIFPYQQGNIDWVYGGLDIDDFVITESVLDLPITLNWGKHCSEFPQFTFQMPSTPGITYNWILPGNAVISTTNAPNDIIVNWSNAGIATITVEGRNANGCLVYQGSLQVDPNQTPCPNAVYAINNLNATQIKVMFGGQSTIITNQLITINGTITINESIDFLLCTNIQLGLNAKIIVMPGCYFGIYSSTLSACECNWDGIFVESPTAWLYIDNSFISGAKNAVVSSYDGKIDLYGTTFADNIIGTWIRRYNPYIVYDINGNPSIPPPHSAVIKKCKYERIISANYGIVIDTAYNVTIGDVSSSINTNEFKKLYRGIQITASDVNIYNNYFNECFYYYNTNMPNYYSAEPSTTSIFIKSPYYQGPAPLPNQPVPAIKNIVNIGGSGTNQPNSFYKQEVGVYGFNTQVNVLNNSFTDQRFSAVHLRELNKSVEINNNSISMQNNLWASNNLYNSSILTENINGYSTTKLNINSNTINNTRTGINTRNCNGNDGAYYCNVKNNIINFNATPVPTPSTTTPYTGISASNCEYIQVESNNMSYSTANSYHLGLYGIYLSTIQNAKVFSNRNGYMGDGIYIAGTSLGSQYFCNDFDKCWYGFYFNSTTLSHQLLNPIGNNNTSDNYWYDIPPVSSTTALRRMEGSLSSGNQLNWYHRGQTNDYLNNKYTPFILFGDPLYTPINPISNQAENANCYAWRIMNAAGREALLGDIVRDSMNYQIFLEQNEYMGKEFAFKQLDKDHASLTLFVPEDSLYQNFYNTIRLSNIGKNDEVSKAVNAKDYTTALNLNATIYPQNAIESNRKTVHGIYLEKLVNNLNLPTSDSITLLAIALQTPFVGGDAVYTARVILGIDPLQYNLDYALPPIHQPSTAYAKDKIKVYPNPANDKLYIELNNALEGFATIEIYDLNGKLCFYTNINTAQNIQSIDISSVKKGIYNIRITSTNHTENQKLVIIN